MKPSVEPIAILGYSVRLPQGLDSGEKLYEVIKEKRQVAAHRDEVQYPLPSVHDKGDTGSTWKYRVQRGNYFTWDEGKFALWCHHLSMSHSRLHDVDTGSCSRMDMGICVPMGVPSVCDVVRHIHVMTHIC